MIDLIWTFWMRYWSALCAESDRRAIIGWQANLDYTRSVIYPASVDRAAHWNARWNNLWLKQKYRAPTEKQLLLTALTRAR